MLILDPIVCCTNILTYKIDESCWITLLASSYIPGKNINTELLWVGFLFNKNVFLYNFCV